MVRSAMTHNSDVLFEDSLRAATRELGKAPNLVIQGPALSGLSTLLTQFGRVLLGNSHFNNIKQVNFSEKLPLEQAISRIAAALSEEGESDIEQIHAFLGRRGRLLLVDDFDLIEDNQKFLSSLCGYTRPGGLVVSAHGPIQSNVKIAASTRFITHEGLSESEAYILARKLLDAPSFSKETSKRVWEEAQASPFLIRACYNSLSAIEGERDRQAINLAKRYTEEIYNDALEQLGERAKQKLFYFASVKNSQKLRERIKSQFSVHERRALSDLGLANESFNRFFIRQGAIQYIRQNELRDDVFAQSRLEELQPLEGGPDEILESAKALIQLERRSEAFLLIDSNAEPLFEAGHGGYLFQLYESYGKQLLPNSLGIIVRACWFKGDKERAIQIGEEVAYDESLSFAERALAIFNLGVAYVGKMRETESNRCFTQLVEHKDTPEEIRFRAELALLINFSIFFSNENIERANQALPVFEKKLTSLKKRYKNIEYALYGARSIIASRDCYPQKAYQASYNRLKANLEPAPRSRLIATVNYYMHALNAGKDFSPNLMEEIQKTCEEADRCFLSATQKLALLAYYRNLYRVDGAPEASQKIYEIMDQRRGLEAFLDNVEDIAWVILTVCTSSDKSLISEMMKWPIFSNLKDSDYIPQKALINFRDLVLHGDSSAQEALCPIGRSYFYSWWAEWSRSTGEQGPDIGELVETLKAVDFERLPVDVLAHLLVNAYEVAAGLADELTRDYLRKTIKESISLGDYPVLQKRLLQSDQGFRKLKTSSDRNQKWQVFDPSKKSRQSIRSRNQIPWTRFDLVIDESRNLLLNKEREISFSKKPILFRLLSTLAQNQTQALSREELTQKVWGESYNPMVHDARLYSAIADLRRSLARAANLKEAVVQFGGVYTLSDELKVGFLEGRSDTPAQSTSVMSQQAVH